MSGALKLLAIDDTTQNLELIRATLEEMDLEIATAEDPEEGFEIFLRMRPRIVLLDMIMPKVNGMELLERIVAADPGTDVILMTAHYSPESAVEAIQKGACDYFTKPLDIGKLRTRIAGFWPKRKSVGERCIWIESFWTRVNSRAWWAAAL